MHFSSSMKEVRLPRGRASSYFKRWIHCSASRLRSPGYARRMQLVTTETMKKTCAETARFRITANLGPDRPRKPRKKLEFAPLGGKRSRTLLSDAVPWATGGVGREYLGTVTSGQRNECGTVPQFPEGIFRVRGVDKDALFSIQNARMSQAKLCHVVSAIAQPNALRVGKV